MTRHNGFSRFMAGPVGRLLRVVLGLALIAWGWTSRGTTGGTVLMVVGVIPILAGVLNVCLIAPLIRAPFSGRNALHKERNSTRLG